MDKEPTFKDVCDHLGIELLPWQKEAIKTIKAKPMSPKQRACSWPNLRQRWKRS